MYLYNCSSESLSYGEQELKNIFTPQYLRGILGENLWYVLTAFSLVFKYHQPDTIAMVHYPSSKPAEEKTVSLLKTQGQFLYNLYDIPLMPRALTAWALWTISRTSLHFIPLSLNTTVESWGFGKSLRGGMWIQFKSSEYVFIKWYSSSSFGTWRLPLFYSTKSLFFLCKSIKKL